MGFFDDLFSGINARNATDNLEYLKAKLAAQNLLSQTSAQSKLGYGMPDPNTGITWNAPSAPTGNYEQADANGNFQTMPVNSAPPQVKNLLADSYKQTDQENANLLRQADPTAFLATDVSRASAAAYVPQLKSAGWTDAQIQAYLLDPKASGEANAKSVFPEQTPQQRNIAALNAMAPDDPRRAQLQAIIDHDAGKITDPDERARVLAQTNEANNAAANSGWVESKDAFGNPILINKQTGQTKKPDGTQMVTDEDVQSTAEMIANYQKKPPSGAGAMRPFNLAIMDRVKQINPDYDERFYNSSNAAQTKFASGKEGALVRSANVATTHLQMLDALGQALDSGDVQAANAIKNKLSAEFGGVPITSYETAAPLVGDEVAKFVLGGNSAVSDREKFAAPLSSATSGPQRAGNINTFKGLMVGQLHGLKQQYETETQRKDFAKKLDPQVAALLENPQYAPGANPNAPTPPPGIPPDAKMGKDRDGNPAWFTPDPNRPGKYIQWR